MTLANIDDLIQQQRYMIKQMDLNFQRQVDNLNERITRQDSALERNGVRNKGKLPKISHLPKK